MKRIFALSAAMLLAAALTAQETPLWLRKNAISPDGSTVAFCYKGDIWLVPSTGGEARQLTSNTAYDTDPFWTPDGNGIVFRSQREGSDDIFLTTPKGGTPRRLTDYPGSETPLAVLSDGKIVFLADLGGNGKESWFPQGTQLYTVGPEGGMPEYVSALPVRAISVAADGRILYEDYKGYEDPLRKHHTSSVTRDIWLCTPQGSAFKMDSSCNYRKISTFEGEDRNPVFGPDGDTYYYLSEQGCKNINLFRGSLSNPSTREQLTFEEKNPVRHVSISRDGTLCFSLNGELYTMRKGEQAKKLEIKLFRDEDQRDAYNLSLSGGATSMAVSPDEKEIAVIVRGDVFVTSTEYSTTRRITNTASQERNLSFSDDGRTLYYSAERNGCWGIYRTTLKNKKDKQFTYGGEIEEELFSDPGETCFYPKVSPDGKSVAYLRDRVEVVVKPVKGGKAKTVLPKSYNYSYQDGDTGFEWSPDSRWILSGDMENGGWNNLDICAVNVESGEITNLTRSGYSDGDYRWALGGKAMTFTSDKNGYRSHGSWGAQTDIFIMFFDGKKMSEFFRDKEDEQIAKLLTGKDEEKLEKEEKKDSIKNEKKPEKLVLDFEQRDNRTFRLTRSSGSYPDHYLAPDGKTLYWLDRTESGSALFAMDLEKREVKRLTSGVSGSITPSKDGKNLYLLGNGITKISLPDGRQKKISYNGEFEFKPAQEREYMFSHIWKQVLEKFYDPALHGIDWNYYKDNYSRFVPYVNNYVDFADLLSEMLGELNGSHTGARAYNTSLSESPSWLGIIQDWSYKGAGIKIAEVLPDGPLYLADPEIKAGDIISEIDGHVLKEGEAPYKYLSRKARQKIAVCVLKDGKKEVKLYVEPIASQASLLYRRWVRHNEETVEKLSGGKVGYVHVEGMDSESFREVFSKALGRYRVCDALIVDTRHNGGGWLHDDLVTLLGGREYVQYRPRGQYIGSDPFNKWNKKSCVLMSEDNYSDASGFPYAYQTLGIGKLIGTPVPGTMTAVWWERQINPAIVFGIPQVGSWAVKEQQFEENNQILPDITVYNEPAKAIAGEDQQLEAAVKEMLRQ